MYCTGKYQFYKYKEIPDNKNIDKLNKTKECNIYSLGQIISILIISLMAGTAHGVAGDEEVLTHPILDIKTEANSTTIDAVIRYPNGCYDSWSNENIIKDGKIVLIHLAEYDDNSGCTRAVEYQRVQFDIKNLDKGLYPIQDGSDGEILGFLRKTSEGIALENSSTL